MNDTILKIRVLLDWVRGAFEEWRKEVWSRDLDERACCDGYECGCGGSSRRDLFAWQINKGKR